ncbi:hypothetical protein B2J88_44430, partial [Rhodococcus sp. SRB_17]|nr:hypothetical protein [Rhodococcus sp. SRB_17]
MALKKGEQFALFEVDEPEVVPAETVTAESVQPSLFDVVDDEVPEHAQPEAESGGETAESGTPDGNVAAGEPSLDEELRGKVPTRASLPPAGESADGHAIIVTAAGTYTPSGQVLTGPVDSVEKLDKLIRWAT